MVCVSGNNCDHIYLMAGTTIAFIFNQGCLRCWCSTESKARYVKSKLATV